MIYERNFYNQSIKNNIKTQENIRKIALSQEENYTTGCLINYLYLKKYIR